MPTVPYNPVPQVTPEAIATPYRTDAGATPEAFGAGVGGALERLGGKVEQAGDMLAQQALVRQDLINQAASDKASAEFMARAGAEHEIFSQKQGADRAAYYPTYQANLEKIRADIRAGLPNAAVARSYDRETLSTLGRTIFNGAGAAGAGAAEDAAKSAKVLANSTAEQGSYATNQAQADAGAQEAYNRGVAAARRSGISDPAALDKAGEDNRADYYQNYITNSVLPHDDGSKGQAEVDRLGNKLGGNIGRVQRAVQTQRDSVQTNVEATKILNDNRDKNGVIDTSEGDVKQQAEARAQKLRPNDPAFKIALQHQAVVQFRQDQQEVEQKVHSAESVVNTLITQGKVSSLQGALAVPEGKKAIDTLKQLKPDFDVGANIYHHVQARDYGYNKEMHDKLEQEAMGSQADRDRFMQRNPYDPKLGLNSDQQTWMVAKQHQIATGKGFQDPNVPKAMNWIKQSHGQELDDLQVDKNDKQGFNGFQAHLGEALRAWTDSHQGRPPSQADVLDVIYPKLIEQHVYTEPGRLWGTREVTEEAFRRPFEKAPEEYAKSMRQQGFTTDAINRAWYREGLKKLLGTKVPLGSPTLDERIIGDKANTAVKPTGGGQ